MADPRNVAHDKKVQDRRKSTAKPSFPMPAKRRSRARNRLWCRMTRRRQLPAARQTPPWRRSRRKVIPAMIFAITSGTDPVNMPSANARSG